MSKDQRQFVRIKTANFLSVEYPSAELIQEFGDMGATINISEGGALFESPRNYPLGALLELTLALGEHQLRISAQVLRTNEFEKGKYAIAVKFLDMSDEDSEILENYLTASEITTDPPNH